MKIVRLLVLSCLLMPAAVAAAQAPEASIPPRLSLAEALRIAEERNPAMTSARAGVAIAAADRVTARARPNPAFTVDSEGLLSAPEAGFWNGQELSLRVDQEFERGGRRTLRTAVAEAGQRSAQASLTDQRRLLSLEVRRSYFQLVLARADQETARASLDEMDRVIAVNRARLDQGEISGGEMRRLQVERLRFMDDVFNAELAARNARSALLALMHAPRLDLEVEPTETLAVAAAPAVAKAVETGSGTFSADLAALTRDALAARPDLAAARGDQARADSETRLQRAIASPNFTFGGGYHRDFGDSGVAFGVTIPLPFFDKNAGGIARADAARQMAASRVAATEVAVALDVQQATNAVEINRARVAYIEREHLQNARQSRDIVLASYGAGAIGLTDFLDAQRAFRETQRAYNRALYDYRVSVFELDAALGK